MSVLTVTLPERWARHARAIVIEALQPYVQGWTIAVPTEECITAEVEDAEGAEAAIRRALEQQTPAWWAMQRTCITVGAP